MAPSPPPLRQASFEALYGQKQPGARAHPALKVRSSANANEGAIKSIPCWLPSQNQKQGLELPPIPVMPANENQEALAWSKLVKAPATLQKLVPQLEDCRRRLIIAESEIKAAERKTLKGHPHVLSPVKSAPTLFVSSSDWQSEGSKSNSPIATSGAARQAANAGGGEEVAVVNEEEVEEAADFGGGEPMPEPPGSAKSADHHPPSDQIPMQMIDPTLGAALDNMEGQMRNLDIRWKRSAALEADLRSEVTSLKSRLSEAQRLNRERQHALDEGALREEDFKTKVSSLEAANSELEDKLTAKTQDFEAMKSEKEALATSLEASEALVAELRAELLEASRKEAVLHGQAKTLQCSLFAVQTAEEAAQEELKALKLEMQLLKETHEALQVDHRQLGELHDQEVQARKASDLAKEELDEAHQTTKAALTELEHQHGQLQASLASAEDKLAQTESLVEEQSRTFARESKSFKEAAEAAAAELLAATEARTEAERQAQESAEAVQRAERAEQEATSEAEKARASIAAAQNAASARASPEQDLNPESMSTLGCDFPALVFAQDLQPHGCESDASEESMLAARGKPIPMHLELDAAKQQFSFQKLVPIGSRTTLALSELISVSYGALDPLAEGGPIPLDVEVGREESIGVRLFLPSEAIAHTLSRTLMPRQRCMPGSPLVTPRSQASHH